MYDVLWNAMFLLILIAFLVGNMLLGFAVQRVAATGARAPTMARGVAIALWAAAGLTFLMLPPELGASFDVSWTEWLYPLIQPAGRTLIGLWLWREATWEEVEQGTRIAATAPA